MRHNKVAPAIDNSVHFVSSEELKSKPDFSSNQEKNAAKCKLWYKTETPTIVHYIVLVILGLLVWGMLWFTWGDGWRWGGAWFRIASVAVAAWVAGLVFQSVTTLPPLLAALLTGILARNVGYLDMRDYTEIDVFLRKIYPVIILGKGSLTWDTDYMIANWRQIVALGAVPWIAEVTTLAICVHYFLGHPWIWGFILGTFYASLSGPVVMPNVLRVGMSPGRTQNWPQFIGTAGGTDTALSVGMYGVLTSFLFSKGDTDFYRYFRAFSTLFVGVGAGIGCGCIAGVIPHSKDPYVVELRVLFVVISGLFASFCGVYFGWGGVAGVAVLACNSTAARFWAKKGWTLNKNPASVAYRVMWSACEPAVFAYTGTFFVMKSSTANTILYGFAILMICMLVRLIAASLMCRKLSFRERIFICCVWCTKSIVEAVLCPTLLNILLLSGGTFQEMRYAEDIVVLTVQEILITTPLAFLLSKYLGPVLIKDKRKEHENGESRE